MATFVLIHGAGDVGWYWHLLERELRQRGHDVVAPDLPCDDDSASLGVYADTVVDAIGDRRDLVVVGQSFGGYTAALVADPLPVELLVLDTAMVPIPGEKAEDWFANTGYTQAVQEQARRDSGKTGSDDPFVVFYHDVPRALAEEALSKERHQSETPGEARGRSTRGLLCRRGLCCAPRIGSFPPTSCAASSPSVLPSLLTRSPPATAWRSAARRSWRICSSATPPGASLGFRVT